jgi:D-3-phosphoglycerate dehydrogenase
MVYGKPVYIAPINTEMAVFQTEACLKHFLNLKKLHFYIVKALLVDQNHDILIEQLVSKGILCTSAWTWTLDEVFKALPQYEILIIRSRFKLDEAVLKGCTNLKIIGRVGAGMENIDMVYAQNLGITCLSIPEGNRDAVAEHALGMLLTLLHKLLVADREVRNGIWRRAQNRGTELNALAVGIIGFGNTGRAFSKLLKPFGCKQFVADPYITLSGKDEPMQVHHTELFSKVNVVSLHIPLNAETRYIINDDFIQQMQAPFYLINTSRGACVDTAALVRALKSGKILGAALDVIEYEGLDFNMQQDANADYMFLKSSDQVVMTPHIAGWTHESNIKMSTGIAQKIIEALKI